MYYHDEDGSGMTDDDEINLAIHTRRCSSTTTQTIQVAVVTPVRDKKQFIKKLVVSQIFCTFTGELQQVTNIFDMTTDYKVTELF